VAAAGIVRAVRGAHPDQGVCSGRGGPALMGAEAIPMLIAMGVLLVCSALASASETALFGTGRATRAALRAEHPALGALVDRLLASPRRLLLQVLAINMATNVAYFIVSSVLTLRADDAAWRLGISVGSVLAIILVGEVFAKLAAVLAPTACLRVLAPIQLVARTPLRPVIGALDTWFITPATRLVSVDAPSGTRVSAEELAVLLEMGARRGVIDETEQDLLGSIVSLSTRRAREIMRPRVDFAWIDADAPREELLALCARTGRTRFPVFEGGLDGTPLGVADADALRREGGWRDALAPVHVVPEQATIDALLDQFRTTRRTLALCVDEHGTVVGLVTLSDIADQIVAGIGYEHDDEQRDRIERIGARRWIVPGRLGVREWGAFFGVSQGAARATTLGGLIMHELARLPREGDAVTIGSLTLRVLEMDGRRVRRVGVELTRGGDAP